MVFQYFFIKLYAKSRFGRRYNIPFLPPDRFFENFSIEAAKYFYTFLHQEIGTAGVNMYIGHKHHGTGIKMRGYLCITGFGHTGDFFRFQDSTDTSNGELQDGGGLSLQQLPELIFCV